MRRISGLITVFLSAGVVFHVSGQCTRSSPPCTYTCHCFNSWRCRSFLTAGCGGFCERKWDGPKCQRENIVLDTMGPFNASASWGKNPPTKAFNGDRYHSSYFTAGAQQSPFMWVKLPEPRRIKYIQVFGRLAAMDPRTYINGFKLDISDSEDFNTPQVCYQDKSPQHKQVYDSSCSEPITGQYVRVSKTGKTNLAIAQLEIYNCSDYWYGKTCDRPCNCRSLAEVCDKVDGRCDSGCPPGFAGTSCDQDCPFGQYGQNCFKKCGKCASNRTCNKVDGICYNGCRTGYLRPNCTECMNGRYGSNCTKTCGHCSGNVVCDKKDGSCPGGCAAGSRGSVCKDPCTNTTYGENCADECGHCAGGPFCDRFTGHCDNACAPGFKGPLCKTKCEDGRYGEGCAGVCGNCLGSGSCDSQTGKCPQGCEPGYTSDLCDTECQNKTFGSNCGSRCNCAGDVDCHFINGSCGLTGCEHPYTGDSCQQRLDAVDSPPGDTGNTATIAGGVAAAVVAVLAVVLFVVLRRRRSKPARKTGEVNDGLEDTLERQLPQSIQQLAEKHAMAAENNAPVEEEATEYSEPIGENDTEMMYANTTQIPQKSPTTVHVKNLVSFLTQRLKNPKALEKEFEKLPTDVQKSCDEAKREQNAGKCRYRDLLPYDETRVVLDKLEDAPYSDFFNASYISGYSTTKAYIASQGTTANNIVDFWRMVWQVHAGKIVMLSSLYENGKEKVLKYWPDEGVAKFGDISVETTETLSFTEYCVRTLKVQKGGHVRNVRQFHFLKWPDHKSPRDTPGVIEFREKVNHTSSKLNGPIVVHCSAGVGRTGTYIAYDYLMKKMESEEEVDIFQTVVALRHQRVKMVQTKVQYTFLHKLVRDAYLSRGCGITAEQLAKLQTDSDEFTRRLQSEMKVVGKMSENFPAVAQTEGQSDDDEPGDISRIWLSTAVKGRPDYIEAQYLPTVDQGVKLIATKIPIGEAVVDFWRMVYDYKCTTLVLLDQVTKAEQYWPDSTGKFGPFEISVVEEDVGEYLTTRQLSLVHSGRGKSDPHIACQFIFTGWSEGDDVFPSESQFLDIRERAVTWQRQREGPIVIQCRDSCERTSLFCAVNFIVDILRMENYVNVPLVVKRFRSYNQTAIQTTKQYKFCYQVARAFNESSQIYANI